MCIFYKISALSLGYPLGKFGVSFGALSCLTRAGLDIGLIKHGAKVQKILNICKYNSQFVAKKFTKLVVKIRKLGSGNSQSDGGKVNNYQPLKTISYVFLFTN